MNVRLNLHKYWILYLGLPNKLNVFHMLKVPCLQKRSPSSTISSPPKLLNHNRQQTSSAQFVIQQKSIKWSHKKKENSAFAACCSVPHGSKFLDCFKWSVQEGRVIFKKKKKRWCMRWWKRRLEENDENVFALLGKHSKGYKYKEEWSHSGALQRLKQFVLSYWWFKKCFIFPGHKSTQITRFINLKLIFFNSWSPSAVDHLLVLKPAE